MPVFEEHSSVSLGTIDGMVLHPDSGRVEGFFVKVRGFLRSSILFLSSVDIARFGLRVTVRSREALAPPEEFLRIKSLLEDDRTILDQSIRTDDGTELGRCADVQFDTTTLQLTWIFPKKFLRWGIPIASKDILEVKKDAVIVRGTDVAVEEERGALLPVVPEVEG